MFNIPLSLHLCYFLSFHFIETVETLSHSVTHLQSLKNECITSVCIRNKVHFILKGQMKGERVLLIHLGPMGGWEVVGWPAIHSPYLNKI